MHSYFSEVTPARLVQHLLASNVVFQFSVFSVVLYNLVSLSLALSVDF